MPRRSPTSVLNNLLTEEEDRVVALDDVLTEPTQSLAPIKLRRTPILNRVNTFNPWRLIVGLFLIEIGLIMMFFHTPIQHLIQHFVEWWISR